MKTFYQVRFVCYQYNRCGDNGRYEFNKNFDKLEDAKAFECQVKKLSRCRGSVPEGSNEFARDYVHEGFVDYFVGTFKITEESVNG